MNPHPLEDFIADELAKAWQRKLVELGYWCPRCDCEAFPLTEDETAAPGWCPICGLDPLTPGPAPPPSSPQGIRGAI